MSLESLLNDFYHFTAFPNNTSRIEQLMWFALRGKPRFLVYVAYIPKYWLIVGLRALLLGLEPRSIKRGMHHIKVRIGLQLRSPPPVPRIIYVEYSTAVLMSP